MHGNELWLAGSSAIARVTLTARDPSPSGWSIFALDAETDTTTIAPAGDELVVIATTGARSTVLRFGSTLVPVSRTTVGAGLATATSDGDGGLWSVVVAPPELRGYAHFHAGEWTLFTATPPPAAVEGVAAVEPSAVAAPRAVTSSDGAGGFYALVNRGIVHVARDGVASPVAASADEVAAGSLYGCWALERAGDGLVFSPRQGRERLAHRARDGRTTYEALPRTAAGRDRCVLAVGGDTTWMWLARDTLMIHADTGWTVVAPARERVLGNTPPRDRDAGPGSYVFGASVLAAGALASSALHDDSLFVPGAQLLGGLVGIGGAAALGLLALEATSRSEAGAPVSLGIGIAAVPVLVPVGAWAAGELMRPSQHPWRALGGAALGEVAGVATGLVMSQILHHTLGRHAPATWSVVGGLAGSGVMIGYQALGGGRAN